MSKVNVYGCDFFFSKKPNDLKTHIDVAITVVGIACSMAFKKSDLKITSNKTDNGYIITVMHQAFPLAASTTQSLGLARWAFMDKLECKEYDGAEFYLCIDVDNLKHVMAEIGVAA